MNLINFFKEKTTEFSENPCLFFFDREYSYGDFAKNVYRLAHGLKELGIGKGDFVHVLVENSPETLISYFAIQHLGAVAGPINGWWKADEVRYLLNDSKGKALIIGPQYLKILDEIRADCPDLKTVIEIGGTESKPNVGSVAVSEIAPT